MLSSSEESPTTWSLFLDFTSFSVGGTSFFLKAGSFGMDPRNPNPSDDDPGAPLVIPMFSRCRSNNVEISSVRGIRVAIDFTRLFSSLLLTDDEEVGNIFSTLDADVVVVIDVMVVFEDDGTIFEC